MSEPFATSDAIARAKEWLEAASSKWRLQTLQHRSKYNPKTGEYRQLPVRVRRFLNGTPAGMKAAVLAVLEESAPYRSPVFDLERDGLEYVPTSTFIRKDGVEHSTNQRDATYTIIQDLKLADGVLDRFSFADESSCASVGESEYRWDEPDVEPCPDGSQGVSYQVSNVSRDRETDLFSYQVRKVQALTQHVQPHVTQCDETRRVTVETWNNLYGEPGSFRTDPVSGGSAKVELPAPCDQPDGTTVQVSVTENADCTYRVELTTVEARTLEGQFSIYRDQYKVQETERTQNAFAPLSRQGVEHSGGVTKRFSSEPNADGTWSNSVETETERPVRSSSVEVRVMPRHTVRTRIDTNVPEAADAVPGGGYGSYKSTKTQGGLFTNEYVQYLRTHLGDLGLVCADTAFLKTHETQETADAVPAGGHVPAAANGRVTTWNYDTDAEGIVTKRVRTESEHEVRDAVRRRTWGYLGTTSGYTHRSVPKSVMESLMASQEKGTSVEARMTNGALWDVEVQTFLKLAGQSLGLDCQKTVYQHVHETAVSVAEMGDEASEAGGGRTYRRSFRLDTATGAVTRTDTTTTELEVPESRRVVRVTARGKTVRTTKANTPAKPSDASRPGETTEFEVTPGGRYNVTVERSEPTKAGPVAKECSADVFQETDASVTMQESASAEHVASAGGGRYREKSQRLGDDGLWEVRDGVVTEKPNVEEGREVVVTARGKRKTVRTRQKTSVPAEPGVDDAGRSQRTQRTRGGLWNVDETVFVPRTGESGRACERDRFVHTDSRTRLSKTPDTGHVADGAAGEYSERTSRLGDDGLWEETTVTHKEREVRGEVDVVVTSRGKRKTTITRQTSDPGTEPGADDVGKSFRRTKTRGGLNNIESTEFTPRTQDSGEACTKDLFQHSHSTTKLAKEKPSDKDVEDAKDGKYRERQARLGDDGLWEVVTTEHKEETDIEELDAVVTARGRKTVKTTRQTKQQGTEPGADEAGKALRRTRTRGGLYNIETVEITKREGDNVKACERDHFVHTDSTTCMKKVPPGEDLPEAADGKYSERTSRLGDDGLWEETTVTHKEREVRGEVDVVVTSRGKRKTTITRQTSDPGEEPEPDEAGKSFRRTKTRGGLNNIESTEFTPRTQDSGKACSRDLFVHTDETTSLKEDPLDDCVASTDDLSGEYRERRQRLGDDGLWEVVTTKHKEQKVDSQRVEIRVTKSGLTKRTTSLHVVDEGDEPEATVEDIGKERIVEKTRGGKRNVTTVEVKPIRQETERRCEKDAFLHTHVTVKGVEEKDDDHVEDAGDGKYLEVTYRMNELGVWEEIKTEYEEKQPKWTGRSYKDAFGDTTVFEDMSVDNSTPRGEVVNTTKLLRHTEVQKTKGGHLNVRTTEERPQPVDSQWLHFEKETSDNLKVYHDIRIFRNLEISKVKTFIEYIKSKNYTGANGTFANRPNVSIAPNKFGLWDGSVSLVTTFTPKAWAAGGSVDSDNIDVTEYTVKDVSVSPLNSATTASGIYLLEATTTETHERGGGVGKDRLAAAISGTLIRGSQFSYHPAGQSFQYDIIKKRTVTYKVIKASDGSDVDGGSTGGPEVGG